MSKGKGRKNSGRHQLLPVRVSRHTCSVRPELQDGDEEAVWATLWEDADSPLVADYKSDYMPGASVQARRIGRFGVVRVAYVEYAKLWVTFWVTRKSGVDETLRAKARNEWSDLETMYEDAAAEARCYQGTYLPREAEGVREW